MLLEINISNFALIDTLKLEFREGLNILTGETGAGKSIIIDAIGLILGGRASVEMVRREKDFSFIEGIFKAGNDYLLNFLLERGIEPDEDILIIQREINTSGRNICRINGRTVTLSTLKDLGQLLIDIHGQHEHQSLMRWEKHIEILDSLGGTDFKILKDKIRGKHREYKELKNQLSLLLGDQGERDRSIDYIKHQIKEIENANLKPGEDDILMEKRKKIANMERIISLLNQSYNLINEGHELTPSINNQLSSVIGFLEQASSFDTGLEKNLNNINSAFFILQDEARELNEYIQQLDIDNGELAIVEDRLELISKLKRKYGQNIEGILSFKEDLYVKLKKLEDSENAERILNKEISNKEDELIELSSLAREKRKELAKKLEEKLIEQFKDLEMVGTSFKVNLEDNYNGSKINGYNINDSGFDKIEFLITPNVGEPLKPLVKIASGGELSRTMLALKTVLTEGDSIPTQIFDEIDTGIGGRAVVSVALKLALIAKHRQVICVTHSPQIAAMADIHNYISKTNMNNSTLTKVETLSRDGRIKEISRMLKGDNITLTTTQHAEEMLLEGDKYKATV
jgi:DNA repair protein RecN (Recombination protein N)